MEPNPISYSSRCLFVFEESMDTGQHQVVIVIVKGAERLYKRIVKNTKKMSHVSYTVLVGFFYWT